MKFQTKKRTFVGLLLAALLILGLFVYYIWHLTFFKTTFFSQLIFLGLIIFLVGLAGVTFLGLVGIILSVFNIPLFPSWQKITRISVNAFYPFIIQLGKVFKITQDKIQRSFIELNNYLVEVRNIQVQPKELLLLLPHCLQQSDCSYRITIDIKNCRSCGGCMIGSLMDLAQRYRIKVKVVTGGTLARKEIESLKPKAIIAVACERDLSSGILEASPLPVLGISNERPYGPCHNTCVNLGLVEEGINFFLKRCGEWK
ncbi:DUF116 domain-containing protein [Candidatus Contubernalis alkaliaceticus]|uniref:DUF116 domain-containing protein n=1 Tax=Candidatus Contubernalis alkaliaceticus TaxID=338645 RepID=UPI001F4BDF93|nr:DUF116 domain-containing protein [Candidatus Contubernalis alkalaceticus]UNC92785.1 DUF116 domain-containing protein [Candidatus Contubernalis alkalaceticus]